METPAGSGDLVPDEEREEALLDAIDDDEADGDEDLLDRLRGTGVGVEDPNIVGDAGPTDVAPGRDTSGDGLLEEGPGAEV